MVHFHGYVQQPCSNSVKMLTLGQQQLLVTIAKWKNIKANHSNEHAAEGVSNFYA